MIVSGIFICPVRFSFSYSVGGSNNINAEKWRLFVMQIFSQSVLIRRIFMAFNKDFKD